MTMEEFCVVGTKCFIIFIPLSVFSVHLIDRYRHIDEGNFALVDPAEAVILIIMNGGTILYM